MSSKFWAAGSDSGSESDSDSDSDSSLGGNVGQQRRQWAVDSDSESEDEVRVVRSAKDRSFEAIRGAVHKVKNGMKINDWNGIQTDFDECTKHIEKSKVMIAKEGVPKFYVKLLTSLEDFLTNTLKDKAAVKKMSATNTRSLNRMKLHLRKHNKAYEKEIADCRAHPEAYGDSDADSASDSESDDGSSSSSGPGSGSDSDSSGSGSGGDSDSDSGEDSDGESSDSDAEAAKKPKKPQRNLEDMDSDEWPSDSDEDDSSEDESSEDEEDMPKGRARWLKKTPVDGKKKKKDEKKAAKVDKGKKEKVIEVKGGKGALPKLDLNMAPEHLGRKLREVLASRGKKGSDPKEVRRQLAGLAYISRRFGPIKEIPILMYLVSAMFDTLRNIDDYMETAMWRSCQAHLSRVVILLEEQPELQLGQLGNEAQADLILRSSAAGADLDDDEDAEAEEEVKKTGILKVVGTLATYAQKLDEEYNKSLQKINPHTQEYIMRLKDEAVLFELAGRVQAYYERIGEPSTAADMALSQAEHMYYQHDSIANKVRKAQAFTNKWGKVEDLHPACAAGAATGVVDAALAHPAAALGVPTVEVPERDYSAVLRKLCVYVYRNGDDRTRTRAMLCHITHHALNDRFFEARDLLLMSHLQDNISQTDVATQILYNRMMATLGLCAFRQGLVQEAHDCLRDVCSSRVKELLAQGIQINRFQDKNPEQEKAERRRQMPYHTHINLDLLECCHLTSAMLLEVPNMAQESTELRRRVISKHFRRHMDIYSRQVFTGPPENIRDHVIAASKRLIEGDWRKCADLVLGLDMWNLIPGEGVAERVKDMVRAKIQEEALRTYLFTYSPYYESLSLPTLCEMFALDKRRAHSIISKMMINQELYGSWDQPTETIVLRKDDPSPLQLLALKFADKAANLVESNERLIDARTGGYGYRDDKGWGGGGRGGRGGGGDWGGGGRGGFNSDRYKNPNARYQGRDNRGYQRGGRGDRGGRGGRGGNWSGGRGSGNYIRERRDMGLGRQF